MLDFFEPGTKWIEDEARAIAKKQNKDWFLVEMIGLTAYRVGDTDDEVRSQMKAGKLRERCKQQE